MSDRAVGPSQRRLETVDGLDAAAPARPRASRIEARRPAATELPVGDTGVDETGSRRPPPGTGGGA